MEILMEPIGIIRTPYKQLADMPIQPRGGQGVKGDLIIKPEYSEGLADLDGFSHIYLLYLFHEANRNEMKVVPFMDDRPRGVFATRSPLRPNHIGLSIVELEVVEENRIVVKNIDILDNTPLLDIKPYIKAFDGVEEARSGWMKGGCSEVERKRSDSRFI